jgi:signal transduction histidine kinase
MPAFVRDTALRYEKIILIAVLCAAYVITARIGLSIYAVHGFATLVWPPTGIAIAALLLYGRHLWPGIALGAFFVNFWVGASPLVALGIAIGNTLEALAAVYLLHRFAEFDISFGRLRDSLYFILFGALLAPLVSASVGTGSLLLGGVLTFGSQPITWLAWWVGDMLGALVVAPLLLLWMRPQYPFIPLKNLAEALFVTLMLVVFNILIFWKPFPALMLIPLYPVFVPLAWIALRFGIRGHTLAIAATATMAIAGISAGHLLIEASPVAHNLIYLQFFISTTTAMLLIFGAIVEERRRYAEELSDQIDQLADALQKIKYEDEAKKEFLALLAHELRNPLAPLVSNLEYLALTQTPTPESEEIHANIAQQTKTIIRLVDDLLDVSRISQKRLHLQKELTDLQSVVTRSAKNVEQLFQKNNLSFTLLLPPEPTTLEVDSVRFEQIVVNLLTNAGKYTPQGGTIACEVSTAAGILTLIVRDNGIGIPPTMLEKIFEPFMQVNHIQKQGAGLGVGLSLTRYLVEMHGGSIVARSDGEGLGSEFIVTLPLGAPAEQIFTSPSHSVSQN